MKLLNQEQLKRFANNTEMNEAVKEVLLEVYMRKPSNADANVLAGHFIAIDLLQEAWREIDEYRSKPEEETPVKTQIGI